MRGDISMENAEGVEGNSVALRIISMVIVLCHFSTNFLLNVDTECEIKKKKCVLRVQAAFPFSTERYFSV